MQCEIRQSEIGKKDIERRGRRKAESFFRVHIG
jgi:hypothetical protein